MNGIAYLPAAFLILLLLAVLFMSIASVTEIYTLGNRIEDGMIAAGWAGFKTMDLDRLAERADMDDEASRYIRLDKTASADAVTEYLKVNLKLDDGLYPLRDSFLPCKDEPVVIKDIRIYNPEDLPATCKGVYLERTTIHIVIAVPVEIRWLGLGYAVEKRVDVDIKAFTG